MSQFDRYDNPTLPKECEWEVFPDKDNPNIINIRFGKYREVTIPNKYQWEDGQKIRVLDIPAYSIQTCDFSVNGMSEEIVHFIGDDGLIGIPNKLFEHHGDVKCFINHIGEDNTTIVRVVNFKINARPKPENYISPEDEPTFREWIQETLDKGTIKDITEEESLEDGGVNVVTITMNDDNTYTFYVHNGNKGDKGETGNTPEFSIGTVEGIPAGQPPYVTITGTKDEPVLNFGLVSGSNGQGVDLRNVTIIEDGGETRGEVIPVGAVVGMTTYDIKLYNIKGADGVNGTDGDKINDATINSDSGSTRVVLRVVGMTVNGGKIYDFDFYNIKGDSGEGVPVGGTTGQILAKTSDEDYDTEWIDPTTEIDVDDHLDTESENPVQNKVLADIIPYKADYTYVNDKVDELNTSIGTKASTTYVETELAKKANASDVETALSSKADVTALPDSDELVPSFSITEAGKVLTVSNDGESTGWTEIPQPQNELPDIETGDAGKVLAVNQAEDGVEWVTPQGGSDLPDIQSGDAGKVLTVNQAETGTEWAEVPKELPNVTNVDDGKLLGVDSGTWAKVDAPKELPTVSSEDSGKALMVNSNGNWVADNIPNELPSVTSTDNGKVLQVSNGAWSKETIPVLPAVTVADEGDVLTVNASGQWENLPPASSGTMSFSGSGAPISSIIAKEGDIYRDINTDRLYICSQYVNPLYVTNLKGLTITLPTSMPLPVNGFDDVSYQFGGTYTGTLRIDEISSGGTVTRTFNHYNMSSSVTDSKVITTAWSSGAWNRVLFSDSQTNLYGNNPTNTPKVIFYFPDNVDVTSEKLVRWFIDNAIDIVGAGAIWKEVYALPDGIPNGTYERAILQWNNSTGKWENNAGTIDLRSSGSTAYFIRLNPASSIEIWNSGIQKTILNSEDLIWKNSGNYNISLHRQMFNNLGGVRDANVDAITSNSSLNQNKYCRIGHYGYVADTVAATLTDCPTTEGFSMFSMTVNGTMYNDSTYYQSNTYYERFIITLSGKIYKQSAYYLTSGNYVFGNWERLITSEEVPDVDTTTDGTYVLKCTVTGGVPTYSWVLET